MEREEVCEHSARALGVLFGRLRSGADLASVLGDVRLLLGVAEGGVWPAVLVLLSHWFPRGERARANAYWMLCLPIAVIVSAPLSGWILSHWNWRVLLIAEGALPFLWLIMWSMFVDDFPREARWISPEEQHYLETTLESESSEMNFGKSENVQGTPWRELARPAVLVMVVVYLLQNIGNLRQYAVSWLSIGALQNDAKAR